MTTSSSSDQTQASSDNASAGGGSPFVRRMIPTVAAVGLTLGAGACGDSPSDNGDNGDNGSNVPTVDDYRDFCSDVRSCSEQTFSDYFSSLDDCADYYGDLLSYYLDTNNTGVDQSCVDAVSDYWTCIEEESYCDSDGAFFPPQGACESEYMAVSEECPLGSQQ